MRQIKQFFLAAVAAVLIIEEWLWDILSALGSRLSHALRLQKFEIWLSNAPPRAALLVFIVPILVVTPINLLGLALIAKGMFLWGLIAELVAKLLGTLMVARVFKLAKPQLLTYKWIAFPYHKIHGWLTWAHERIQSTEVYRLAKQAKARIWGFRRLTRRPDVPKSECMPD